MRVVFVAAILLLAGCTGTDGDDQEPAGTSATKTSTSATQSSSTSSSTTTAPPAPEDCEPTVRPSGNRFIAECTVTRGLDPNSQPDLVVDAANGYIQVTEGPDTTTARLWAQRDSEEEARAALEEMTLTIDADAISIIVDAPTWNNRGADVSVQLSTGVLGDVNLDTSNGLIELLDFGGLDWVLDTSNGDVRVSGGAESISIDTSNGAVNVDASTLELVIDSSNAPITIKGQHVDIVADGSNGALTVDATASDSGIWDLSSSNAPVIVKVPEPADTGYDVTVATSNAVASINLKDTEAVGSQSNDEKHERTVDYDDRLIQVEINVDTSNAGASVMGK